MVLAGVVVAVPYDMEAEAMDTLEFGLPADALQHFGRVEGMPIHAYLFRTQELVGELEAAGAVWLDESRDVRWRTRLPARWSARRRPLGGRSEAAHVLGQLDWFDSVRRRWGLSGPQVAELQALFRGGAPQTNSLGGSAVTAPHPGLFSEEAAPQFGAGGGAGSGGADWDRPHDGISQAEWPRSVNVPLAESWLGEAPSGPGSGMHGGTRSLHMGGVQEAMGDQPLPLVFATGVTPLVPLEPVRHPDVHVYYAGVDSGADSAIYPAAPPLAERFGCPLLGGPGPAFAPTRLREIRICVDNPPPPAAMPLPPEQAAAGIAALPAAESGELMYGALGNVRRAVRARGVEPEGAAAEPPGGARRTKPAWGTAAGEAAIEAEVVAWLAGQGARVPIHKARPHLFALSEYDNPAGAPGRYWAVELGAARTSLALRGVPEGFSAVDLVLKLRDAAIGTTADGIDFVYWRLPGAGRATSSIYINVVPAAAAAAARIVGSGKINALGVPGLRADWLEADLQGREALMAK
ncbi:hypothetical protein WJX81_001280 [Elliptochloris bilobata]|uniref:Uncharacterized protein n=1 Tax=Elliptochloris bilobata TaxID=381761 RepID=A0AAW1RG61_9CHLO